MNGTSWPPKFQTYDEYKQELIKNFDEHEPFANWFVETFSTDEKDFYVNEEYNSIGQYCKDYKKNIYFMGLSVEKLKAMYIEDTKKKNLGLYGKIACIELCFNQLSGIEEAENVYQNIKLSYKKNNNNSEPPKPLVLQKRDKLIKLIESIKSHL